MNFQIETIAIGDELLTGQISDTNSTFVAKTLRDNGLLLGRTSVILDRSDTIWELLEEVSQRASVVVSFGGLGPTSDDITAESVAKFVGCQLVDHAPSLERLHVFLKKRGREATPEALKQVKYPELATAIPNPVGIAPGFHVRHENAEIFFLPGVPSEMRVMFLETVLPKILGISRAAGFQPLQSRTWRLYKIWESEIQRRMNPVESALPKGSYLGYRTSPPENYLTLYTAEPQVFAHFGPVIQELIADSLFAEGDQMVEKIVLDTLRNDGKTLALAESCTGGLVASRLASIPGASDVLWGSAVTYQLGAKQDALCVSVSVEDAVSERCTRLLAEKVKALSKAPVAGAVTGYLGPSGGTPTDPVGTIYVCALGARKIEERLLVSSPDRRSNQEMAATHLLHAIRRAL